MIFMSTSKPCVEFVDLVVADFKKTDIEKLLKITIKAKEPEMEIKMEHHKKPEIEHQQEIKTEHNQERKIEMEQQQEFGMSM